MAEPKEFPFWLVAVACFATILVTAFNCTLVHEGEPVAEKWQPWPGVRLLVVMGTGIVLGIALATENFRRAWRVAQEELRGRRVEE